MSKKGASTPDPYATAAAQTQSNQQTANYNAALNRVDQYTPYGSSVYTQTGKDATGAPTYAQTTTLTPLAQQELDNEQKQDAPTFAHLPRIADPEQAAAERPPFAPEIPEQRRRRADMEHDQERQERRPVLVEVPAEQARQDHRVAQTADGKQLGRPLHGGDPECL